MTQHRVRMLNQTETLTSLPRLTAILLDCIDDGASVGFLSATAQTDAPPFWSGVASAVGEEATLLFVAEIDGEIAGTVQLGIKLPPNQPHRADLKKLLVHRKARGLGLAGALMSAAEAEAARRGKIVLVLDTATGSVAESIYAKLGWQRVGVIPDYAMMPDGSYCGSTFFYKRLAQ